MGHLGQQPVQRLSEVLENMEAVGYLHRLECCLPYCIRKCATPVPTDDLDALGLMLLQPCCQGSGFAVRQHVYDAMLFKVDHNGAAAYPAAERKIFDSQDPQGRSGRLVIGQHCLAHQTQQRIAARSSRGKLQADHQAVSGLAAQGETYCFQTALMHFNNLNG